MKIFKTITACLMVGALCSCDPVGEKDRFVEITPNIPEQEQQEDAIEKTVLLEEFTGQYCSNCPLGHETLKDIQALYGDKVVIVSIHASEQAEDDPIVGLKTAEGDGYAKKAGVQKYPSAIVDRTTEPMNDRLKWQGAVYAASQKPAGAQVVLKAHVEDGRIVVESTLRSAQPSASAYFQLWITESNIVAFQKNGDNYVNDYVHHHVYRASINGIGGEKVELTNDNMTLKHSIEIHPRWKTQQINIVGFLYSQEGVWQAASTTPTE